MPTPRLYNVDKRLCLEPGKGWVEVARNITIEEVQRVIHDGLHLPEITPHVYRAYNIYDNPGA